jgi:hypothetical protein
VANRIRKSVVLGMIALVSIISIQVITLAEERDSFAIETDTLLGNDLYLSNRYTQIEDNQLRDDANNIETSSTGIVTDYTVHLTNDDQFISTNAVVNLYFNQELMIFKIETIETGYLWSSSFIDVSPENSDAIYNRLTSMVLIEYYPYNEETKKVSESLTEHNLNGYVRRVGEARRDMASVEAFIEGEVVTLWIDFIVAEISFPMQVYLANDGLHVYIPSNQITENNNLLASISVFPMLGATVMDNVPGYVIFPDGTGALYRYKDTSEISPVMFNQRYYGMNLGVRNNQSTSFSQLSFPFFGTVHGLDQDGFYAHIISGAENATLVFNPAGASNIRYNYVTNKYLYRESYIYPTSLSTSNSGGGITMIETMRSQADIHVLYQFVSGDDASYTGIAKVYGDYLIDSNQLQADKNQTYGIDLEFLMSESSQGLFGEKVLVLSTFKEIKNTVSNLIASQVAIRSITLKGWAQGGLTGHTPYRIRLEGKVGSKQDLEALMRYCRDQGIQLSFYNDYVKSYETSERINSASDIAKGLHKLRIKTTQTSLMREFAFYLDPKISSDLMNEDIKSYQKLTIDSLALDTMGSLLFTSVVGNEVSQRHTNALSYQSMLDSLETAEITLNLYQPNAYLWFWTETYLDYPMFNQQIRFYDDTIPFLSLVLQNSMVQVSQPLNLMTNVNEMVNQILEYGLIPSFLLTNHSLYELKYTDSWSLLSSQVDTWEAFIIDVSLKQEMLYLAHQGSPIVSREVIVEGLIKNTYENGVEIVFNHRRNAVTYQEITLQPYSFYVMGGAGGDH